MHALPDRHPPLHPSASLRRALPPTALLWIAALIALIAPASVASALADSPAPPGGHAAHGVAGATAQRAGTGAPGHPAVQRVPALRPPVEGPLVRGFEEAAGPFGPGHRGVDFGAAPGVPVRAPAGGRVTFAGPVAGTTWVSIQVAQGVLVTVGPLRTVDTTAGQAVATGDRLGTLAGGHGGADPSLAAAHLGLRVDGTYVDPLPWLVGLARPRLVPLPEPGGPH